MTGAPPPLPPRPDPDSGEPRPPRAPSLVGAWAGHDPRSGHVRSDRPARPQIWFHDSGPILETVRANRPHAARFAARYLVVSAVGLVVVAGIYLVVNTLRDPGFDLASNAGFVAVTAADEMESVDRALRAVFEL